MALRRLLVVCSLAVAAGCENSQAEKLLDEQRALCLSFASSGMTIIEARRAWGDFESRPVCAAGEDSGSSGTRLRRYAGDHCDHTGNVCDFGWCYPAQDSRLCGEFGCWYGCGVRVVPKDDDQNGILDDDTVICGARFAVEQPAAPFCVY